VIKPLVPTLDTLVLQAKQAQQQWGQVALGHRAKLLQGLEKDLIRHSDRWALQLTTETRKPLRESYQAELTAAIGVVSYYARHGPAILANRLQWPDKSWLLGRLHTQSYRPHGVVGLITPFNFPLAIGVSGLSAALMAGNAVIIKPSDYTPGLAEALVTCLQTLLAQQGYPTALVQYLPGGAAEGKALVAHPGVDHIMFTGSVATGKAVQAVALARGASVNLELGGQDAMLVLPNANGHIAHLDAVLSYAVWGRFANAGQTCAAVKRLLVPQHQLPLVLQALKTKVEALVVGDPLLAQTHMGPLINTNVRNVIAQQVADGLAHGVSLLCGGTTLTPSHSNPNDAYYAPTVMVAPNGPPVHSRLWTEEVFGPVLLVVGYTHVQQALGWINDSPFGLTASVFGPVKQAGDLAQQLLVGVVTLHDTGAPQYALPSVAWLGHKGSGPGVSHGKAGLLACAKPLTITQNWLFYCPWFRKSPWLYHKAGAKGDKTLAFAKRLPVVFGPEGWLGKCNPYFWIGVWQHRSSTRL
jgi:acyl-CoA reductase-like NAD-dependent aldehyde dehydrogenase